MAEREENIVIKLSAVNLRVVEAICAIEHIDRSELLKQLIENELYNRTIRLYEQSKLTASKGAEILGISLREFLQLLEVGALQSTGILKD